MSHSVRPGRFPAILITLLLCLCGRCGTIHAQGLMFLNPADHIDHRTSFDVFGTSTPCFKHRIKITFDIQIPLKEEVGYVARIIDTQSDCRYNVFYEGRGNNWFELNEEGKSTIACLPFDIDKLRDKKWHRFVLMFDFDRRRVYMSIGDRHVVVDNAPLPAAGNFRPRLVFGRSDYLIDVPSFTMRNLLIEGGDRKWSFPLVQGSGTDVYDSASHRVGHVDNPYWAINDQYHWKRLVRMKSGRNAGSCYDDKTHRLYFYNRERLTIYDVGEGVTREVAYANACPVDINLGMGVLDPERNRLYIYEVYNGRKAPEAASVASLDLHTMEWRVESRMQLATQRHHHGQSREMVDGNIFIFGGFGHMEYSAGLTVYDTKAGEWREHDLKGGVEPRYFTSLGYDSLSHRFYIFAGAGNETGRQSIGKQYFYDLYSVSYPSLKVSKQWQLDCGRDYSLVPVRSMVVKGGHFLTLCYSEFMSNAHLRLLKFSAKDGSHTILGDRIPICSDKIATNANIYYDSRLCRYFVTVQEFKDDISSVMTLYSINAEPLSEEAFARISALPEPVGAVAGVVVLVMLLLECAGVALLRHCIRRRRQLASNAGVEISVAPVRPNAIYLFGGFSAFDRHGRDISYMFTNRLCELTVLLLSKGNEGLSSRTLGTMLWGDKDPEKIKNLRSVTVSHLRKVLREMDGVQLVFADGAFKLLTDGQFYVDSDDLMDVVDCGINGTAEGYALSDDELDTRLLEILKRGKLLRNVDLPNLDKFKTTVEKTLQPLLFRRMEYCYTKKRFVQAIEYAEAIFHIDPYNTAAYKYKTQSLEQIDRATEAQEFARRFRKEYRKDYGEELQDADAAV